MTKISAQRRHTAATVHVNGKDKFPIDSQETATNAVRLENTAKPPLTSAQKATVNRVAKRYGVKAATSPSKTKKGTSSHHG